MEWELIEEERTRMIDLDPVLMIPPSRLRAVTRRRTRKRKRRSNTTSRKKKRNLYREVEEGEQKETGALRW